MIEVDKPGSRFGVRASQAIGSAFVCLQIVQVTDDWTNVAWRMSAIPAVLEAFPAKTNERQQPARATP